MKAFAAMSRFVSLCSQRCGPGRLTRSLHWLEKECEGESVCGMTEVRLSLDIAWAACIGCGCGDELDALAALSSLSVYDGKNEDQRKVKEMKGRALACTASFLRWGEKMGFLISLNNLNELLISVDTHPSPTECSLGFTAEQSIKLLMRAAETEDSFAVITLGSCCLTGHILSQSISV